MKKITITFEAIVFIVIIIVSWKAFCNNSPILEIGTFIVLSLTLIVLIWYAYDTNSIARVTSERWLREGVLSTSYIFQIVPKEQNDSGQTLVQLHNPSSLLVRVRLNCNFKIYNEPIIASPPYCGKENWILFPQQISQGHFEIAKLLELKGKTIGNMINEYSETNAEEQLTMLLEIEFWDEFGQRRVLPPTHHHFDFNRWIWIPQLTEQ